MYKMDFGGHCQTMMLLSTQMSECGVSEKKTDMVLAFLYSKQSISMPLFKSLLKLL